MIRGPFRQRFHGRPKRGVMNRTEAAYASHLEGRKLLADGALECHETKGFWQDDAKVKIKVAAEKFPFAFKAYKKLAKKDGGGWSEQEF